jgi:hypothetical protein
MRMKLQNEGAAVGNGSPETFQNSNNSGINKHSGKSKPKPRRPQWSHESKLDRVQSVRRKQIEKVIRDRYGELILPDDHDSRAILRVMLELGCDGVRAQAIAPWCASVLADMIAAAEANYGAWSTKRTGKSITEPVGERIECTLDEFQRLRLTHIWPADADRHVVRECLHQRTLERNRKHNRKRRPKTGKLSDRENAILRDLRYGDEGSIRELVNHKLDAFAGLDRAAARKAIYRAVIKLERQQLVEIRKPVGHRGLETLFVRRPLTDEEIQNIILEEEFPAIDETDDLECERGRPPRGAAAATSVQAADDE